MPPRSSNAPPGSSAGWRAARSNCTWVPSIRWRKPAARTTVQSPLRWSASADWKLDYCNVARLTPDEIARRRAAFDEGKTQAKALREQS